MTNRSTWLRRLAALHRDERGAEGLEKVLILAAVALPLLGLLIYYRKTINEWINETWSTTKSEGDAPFTPPN
jgi:Flp pilus assembly pilin Flp